MTDRYVVWGLGRCCFPLSQSQLVAHTDVELERTLLIHNSHLLLQDVLRRPECSTYKEVLPKQLIDSVAEHM